MRSSGSCRGLGALGCAQGGCRCRMGQPHPRAPPGVGTSRTGATPGWLLGGQQGAPVLPQPRSPTCPTPGHRTRGVLQPRSQQGAGRRGRWVLPRPRWKKTGGEKLHYCWEVFSARGCRARCRRNEQQQLCESRTGSAQINPPSRSPRLSVALCALRHRAPPAGPWGIHGHGLRPAKGWLQEDE